MQSVRPKSPPLDAAAFIRANLPIAPVSSIPEIRLHRAGPKSGLWRLADADEEGFDTPYWAYHWAGGLALARHVLDRPETVTGRRVLDLGAGSGLVGIAALKAGARSVMAAEVDRFAVAAIKLNAALNDVSISIVPVDLHTETPPVDLILVGDLFYAPDLALRVTAFIDCCILAGIEVLIGDPRRADLPLSRLRLIAEYPVFDVGEGANGAPTTSAVFTLEPKAA